ncbi:hypothetical protein [Halorientalis litorea]|uniref:hypothetical protein n=1 Tax=Halorientalis litorea TaxID=2931977 RepID=UPI001FF10B9F|nr:hypothetical protein [Halorientalis litorea]
MSATTRALGGEKLHLSTPLDVRVVLDHAGHVAGRSVRDGDTVVLDGGVAGRVDPPDVDCVLGGGVPRGAETHVHRVDDALAELPARAVEHPVPVSGFARVVVLQPPHRNAVQTAEPATRDQLPSAYERGVKNPIVGDCRLQTGLVGSLHE